MSSIAELYPLVMCIATKTPSKVTSALDCGCGRGRWGSFVRTDVNQDSYVVGVGDVEYLSDVKMYYRVHESNLAYSMYIGASRNLHLSDLWRDFKTLTAFSYLYQDNLNFLERLYLFSAKLEKLAMFFVLRRLMPDSIFVTVYRVFASFVQFIERRV